MTKYLNPQPFSAPVSSGNLTAEEYFVRVGALVFCHACGKNVSAPHECEKFVGIMYVPKGAKFPQGGTPGRKRDQYEPT